jgi:hypothetical protein
MSLRHTAFYISAAPPPGLVTPPTMSRVFDSLVFGYIIQNMPMIIIAFLGRVLWCTSN